MGPLSVGIDLVDVREVAESIATFGDRYLSRVYTEGEVASARARPEEMARRLGARFAAKEATYKVIGRWDRAIAPRSIEIVHGEGGAPEIVLTGEALTAARERRVKRLALSLTHQSNWAAAVVIAEYMCAPTSRLRRAGNSRFQKSQRR